MLLWPEQDVTQSTQCSQSAECEPLIISRDEAEATMPTRLRVDRIAAPLAAAHESAFGTKRTCSFRSAMSTFGGKADMVTL